MTPEERSGQETDQSRLGHRHNREKSPEQTSNTGSFENKITRRTFVKSSIAGAAVLGVAGTVLTGIDELQASGSQSQPSNPGEPSLWQEVTFTLNGTSTTVKVQANWSLSRVLRERLGMTGTKVGCNNSACGACTVLLDGAPVYSCHKVAAELNGHEITTIEGIGAAGSLHPVQQAFIDYGAPQCGYCIPGQIMSAVALLKANPNPTESDVREGLSGNICKCGNYVHIIQAVMAAAGST